MVRKAGDFGHIAAHNEIDAKLGEHTAGLAGLPATYVTFKNFDGSSVVGSNVVITLTADGTDIQDITVEAI